jgi:hypothetical protein
MRSVKRLDRGILREDPVVPPLVAGIERGGDQRGISGLFELPELVAQEKVADACGLGDLGVKERLELGKYALAHTRPAASFVRVAVFFRPLGRPPRLPFSRDARARPAMPLGKMGRTARLRTGLAFAAT